MEFFLKTIRKTDRTMIPIIAETKVICFPKTLLKLQGTTAGIQIQTTFQKVRTATRKRGMLPVHALHDRKYNVATLNNRMLAHKMIS